MDVVVPRRWGPRRISSEGRDIYAVTAPIVVEGAVRLLDGRNRGPNAHLGCLLLSCRKPAQRPRNPEQPDAGVPQAEPTTVKPQASPLVAPQTSRIARPERFSVTAPYPERDTLLTANSQNLSVRNRLEDVAYAQVRRRTVKIRANF